MNKRTKRCSLAIAAALVTALVYLPSFRNDFLIWDDINIITNNYHIRSLDWTFIKWAFTDMATDYWKPLTWISVALDYHLWGNNPSGHHLTAIILHVVNTVLAMFLAIRLLETKMRIEARSGLSSAMSERTILITAGVTGMLFGIHPVHVEPVTWISNRVDLLYPLFYMLSIMVYARHAEALEMRAEQKEMTLSLGSAQYLLSLGLFMLALASKPSAVTLPAVLLILDWYLFRRIGSWRSFVGACWEKAPFILLGLIASANVYWVERIFRSGRAEEVSYLNRVLVAFKAIFLYLWHIFVPVDLSPFYPYPKHTDNFLSDYMLYAVIVSGITAYCLWMVKRHRLLVAIWGYFLVMLLPMLGFIKVREVFMADRYQYLPSLGIFLLAGLTSAMIWEKIELLKQRGRTIKIISLVVVCIIFTVLCFKTMKQISVWKDSITLWNYVIEQNPQGVTTALVNRGMAYKDKHLLVEAAQDYTDALLLDPLSTTAYIGRSLVWREMRQHGRALNDINAAIGLDPGSPVAYTNRGILYGETEQFDRALSDFSTAIDLAPEYADAYVGRGLVFEETGWFDRAIADLNKAITLNPYSADAYLNRGISFEKTGQFDLALADNDKAIALDPSDSQAYRNRGMVFSKMLLFEKSIADYSMAISLNSDFTEAYFDRGNAYLKTGNKELALEDFKRACDLGSEDGCRMLRTIAGRKGRP